MVEALEQAGQRLGNSAAEGSQLLNAAVAAHGAQLDEARTVIVDAAIVGADRLKTAVDGHLSTIDAVLKKIPGIPVVPLAARLEESGLLLLVEFNHDIADGTISAISPARFTRYHLNPALPRWPVPS